MSVESLANLAAVCGVCIAAVNIIVEVLKSFWLKEETSRPVAVLVVSILLSYFVTYMYCEIEKAVFTPMMIVGALVCGFFIAYGAMFGYDKLYGEMFERLKETLKQLGISNEK